MTQSALIFQRPENPATDARSSERAVNPTRIGKPETRLLCALARYHRLTALQITRLLYRPTSLTTVQSRLKRMTDQGLLGRDFPHGAQRAGSAPWIYFLERKGIAVVAELGIDLPRYRREEGIKGFLFYDHTLLVNDILITFDLLVRDHAQIQLETFLHERALKLRPLQVEINVPESGGGERPLKVRLIPDAFVELRVQDPHEPYRLNLAFEADRDSEDQTKWRRKIRSYLAALEGTYQQQFGARSLTVAVITTGGDERVHQLVRWSENELRTRGKQDLSHLFQISTAPASWEQCDPAAFAGDARWWRPFDPTPAPLLTVGEVTNG
jgi:Replication-relaxation